MKETLDDLLSDAPRGTSAQARPGAVSSLEGTRHPENPKRPYTWNPDCGKSMPPDVDGLFGATQGYLKYKTEKFEHRLILWYRLQGFNGKEIAGLMGCSPQTVSWVGKQPWFQTAFCQLAAEMGKDACETFLKGEVLPALERTADLARNGESDAVRLAANKELLDRFLGKSTVKIEAKQSIDVTNTTIDAAKLIEEQRRLDEQIRANGLNLHGPS